MIKDARLDDEAEKNEEAVRKEASLEREEEFNFLPRKNNVMPKKVGFHLTSPFLK